MDNVVNSQIPKLLTIQETAKATGLTAYHIRQMVLHNQIPYIKSGCKYMINLNRFIDYLNNADYRENNKESEEN